MYFVNIKFMRKIAIIGLSLMFIGLGCTLVGCNASYEDVSNKDKLWISHDRYVRVMTKVVEIEGHKYILMKGSRCGNIIHAESCSCKK